MPEAGAEEALGIREVGGRGGVAGGWDAGLGWYSIYMNVCKKCANAKV